MQLASPSPEMILQPQVCAYSYGIVQRKQGRGQNAHCAKTASSHVGRLVCCGTFVLLPVCRQRPTISADCKILRICLSAVGRLAPLAAVWLLIWVLLQILLRLLPAGGSCCGSWSGSRWRLLLRLLAAAPGSGSCAAAPGAAPGGGCCCRCCLELEYLCHACCCLQIFS